METNSGRQFPDIQLSRFELANSRWHSLKLYNAYRVLVAFVLLIRQGSVEHFNFFSFSGIATTYLALSMVFAVAAWFEKPRLVVSLTVQIIVDIIFIVLMMHLVGNADHNGIGLLLIIAVASASLISDGRYALFYAAMATIGLLLEQTYNLFILNADITDYSAAVMLSLACFAIAWLAYSLAKRVQQSENLASQRGLDLKNLSQVNALITQTMKDGVLVVDHQLIVQHHNAQAETLLGIQNIIGQKKSLANISPEIISLMQDWLSVPETFAGHSFSDKIKLNTDSRELRVSFLPISDQRNQGTVIFIEDWSQMQTQAHQVKLAALGRLTANIAHEIRNPLSAISHANQLLMEEENIDPVNLRMLQIINDNVQRVDQIIKDVLELNRRDRTNQETIELNAFIHDFYTQFCAVEKIQPSYFMLIPDASETQIVFDPRHLNQILWNLCKNGWRHSKQQQNSLKLTVEISGDTVMINVIDDGAGVPEQIMAHLFEPFFTTEQTGTGLGLYIAQELADANGATLQCKNSENGAHFIIAIEKLTDSKTNLTGKTQLKS